MLYGCGRGSIAKMVCAEGINRRISSQYSRCTEVVLRMAEKPVFSISKASRVMFG